MKREYTKPDILFDSFSMSTSVAATVCTVRSAQPSQSSCGITFGGLTIFATGISGCTTKFGNGLNSGYLDGNPVVGSSNDAVCYHNPSETYNIYNS